MDRCNDDGLCLKPEGHAGEHESSHGVTWGRVCGNEHPFFMARLTCEKRAGHGGNHGAIFVDDDKWYSWPFERITIQSKQRTKATA